jgi:hypothetical protein
VPLRACIENPQHRFKHMTGRDRFASRTSVGNVLLRKMIPNAPAKSWWTGPRLLDRVVRPGKQSRRIMSR